MVLVLRYGNIYITIWVSCQTNFWSNFNLLTFLQENVRLKVCNISWNGFGPEGGAAMGEALASNNSLLEIDVSGNRLNSDSAVKMARTVSSNDNLRAIRVS